MNIEEKKLMRKILISQDKLIKIIRRISSPVDMQRKTIGAKDLFDPDERKEINALIREYKEIKKQFETGIEKQEKKSDLSLIASSKIIKW